MPTSPYKSVPRNLLLTLIECARASESRDSEHSIPCVGFSLIHVDHYLRRRAIEVLELGVGRRDVTIQLSCSNAQGGASLLKTTIVLILLDVGVRRDLRNWRRAMPAM